MNKIKQKVLAIILILVTIFTNVQPALALEEYEVNLGVDMATAFSNWTPISMYSDGKMAFPGRWSYNSAGYIVNAENTGNMTGFYNPTTNYSDMDITMKMGSWDGDDDTLGCMIRFSEDTNHNCTGYIFAYDRGGAVHGGLYKINGRQFKTASLVQLVSFPNTKWIYQAYDTVRIKASGNNIQVWVNGTRVANYTDATPIESGSYGFFSFSQADSRFTSITGKAELSHFTATFDANGGTLSGDGTKTVTSTKKYGTLPTATRVGYIFGGWYDAKTNGNKITSTASVDIAADTTFYAHWTPVESTVNFDANGGTVTTTSKKVYYEQTIGDMPTPKREGYTFNGWCTAKNGAGGYITSDYEMP